MRNRGSRPAFLGRTIFMRILAAALLALALALAIRGQWQFSAQPEATWDQGIAYYLLAVASFSLAVFLTDHFGFQDNLARGSESSGPLHLQPAPLLFRRQPRRVIALISSCVLTIIVLILLQLDPPLPDYTGPFLLWFAAIGLYALGVVGPPPGPRRAGRANWPLALIVTGIVFAALIWRLYNIAHLPPTLSGDEGSQGIEALKVLRGELRNPFVTSWLSVPTLSFFFNAITIKVMSNAIVGLRLPWAIIGALTVLIVFDLVRRLKGTPLALMTAALLAAYHYHIHFSRLGSNQIADALFMAAAFLFLYRAHDEGRSIDWAMAGVVAGLAQYFYAGARFTTVMTGVTIAWFIVRGGKRGWLASWQRRGSVIAIGAFVITAAPMLQYAIRFPEAYNGRLKAVGIFQSGWLATAQREWKQDAASILINYQLKRAALAYNAYPDRTSWYGSPQPLFDFPMGVLFMLGLGYATLRPFNRRHFPMLVWWWGGIVLGGVLTESPPSSQRLITTAPPAVFFVALALQQAGSIVQRVWPARLIKRALPAIGAAAIIALCIFSLKYYFADYTPLLTYGNFDGVTANGIAHYARERLGPAWRMYFFGPPRMQIDFGSIAYLVPDIEGRDIPVPLATPPPIGFAPDDKNAAFIFLPERRSELDLVRQTYPRGEGEEIPSPFKDDPNPLFIVYRVQLVR